MASFYSGNYYLSQAEMEVNVRYAYNYLGSRGWSINAISGMAGNWESESGCNPGIWESLNSGNTSGGYGLVQWTPATKYLNWCDENGLEPSDLDSALERIIWELENGEQWIATSAYPLSFADFKTSTQTPYYLGMAFLYNYERPYSLDQPNRGTQAQAWYEFLSGEPAPDDPGGNEANPVKKKMALWLLLAASKRS